MANTLTIRDTTTLAQLDAFLKTETNKDQKLLARHNSQGETVLYAKTKATTLLDRILGRTERRKERARESIEAVFTRFKEENPKQGKVGKDGSDALFHHVGQVLNHKMQHGGVRAGDVREMARAAMTIARALPNGTAEQPLTGPTLRSVGMKPNDPAILTAAQVLATGGKDDSVVSTLGDKIASGFLGKHALIANREKFALSDGSALKHQFKQALTAALDGIQPAPNVDEKRLDRILDLVFNRAAAKMLPDGAVDGTSTSVRISAGKSADLPNITLGGEEYKPTRFLGAGGFGNVYEYASVKNPDEKIALKLTNESTGEAVKEAAKEIRIHQSAYGKGCDQVLGLEGKMRMPDGRIGIALEIAPNGDVHEMSELLGKSIDKATTPGAGKITQNEANLLRLSLLKDMVLGLDHLHRKQHVTHCDFKSPNCFIGTDGTVKVADFGLSLKEGAVTGLDKAVKVDNPFFKAPELLRSERVGDRIDDFAEETVRVEAKREVGKLRELLPLATDKVLQTLATSILEPRRMELKEDRSMLFFDRKVDVWGMGASALHLFTGHSPVDHNSFMAVAADELVAYGANRNNQPLSDPDKNGRPQNGAIGLKTGNQQIDTLLGRMLAPDARDRASPSQLLRDPAFKTKGVGSDEARALIVALKSGDPARISAARQALGRVM